MVGVEWVGRVTTGTCSGFFKGPSGSLPISKLEMGRIVVAALAMSDFVHASGGSIGLNTHSEFDRGQTETTWAPSTENISRMAITSVADNATPSSPVARKIDA